MSRNCASLVFVDYAEEPEPGLPNSSSAMSLPCAHALDADELFFVFLDYGTCTSCPSPFSSPADPW